jgi:hypothetical protein
MNNPDPADSPAALAAGWREHAQVLKHYGATRRARMLERMAAELERCTADEAAAVVDLSAASALTGFTRGHLRRLYRDGRFIPAAVEDGDLLFRVADLPRKPGAAPAADRPGPAPRIQIARELIPHPCAPWRDSGNGQHQWTAGPDGQR